MVRPRSQTAVREVHEETGILGEVVDSIATIDYWFTGTSQRVHKLVHHFALRQIGGELTVEGDPTMRPKTSFGWILLIWTMC